MGSILVSLKEESRAVGSREHGRRILLRAREVGDHPVPMSAAVAAQLDELSVHARAPRRRFRSAIRKPAVELEK